MAIFTVFFGLSGSLTGLLINRFFGSSHPRHVFDPYLTKLAQAGSSSASLEPFILLLESFRTRQTSRLRSLCTTSSLPWDTL